MEFRKKRGSLTPTAVRDWIGRLIPIAFAVLFVACRPAANATSDGQTGVQLDAVQLTGTINTSQIARLRATNNGSTALRLSVESTASWIEINGDKSQPIAIGESKEFLLELHCEDFGQVRHAWVLVKGSGLSRAVPVRLECRAASLPDTVKEEDPGYLHEDTIQRQALRLEPPLLERAQAIEISADTGPYTLFLEDGKDYLIVMPNEPIEHGLAINGGHNVVVVGGEVSIPWQGENASISDRRGLSITNATGTVHLEGLYFSGEDLSEGIQVSAPQAAVQITNVAIMDIKARDQVEFSDNHPDLIQTYGNVRSIDIDFFTGSSDYQGFFFAADFNGPNHGPIKMSNVNLIGMPTARYLLWFAVNSGSHPVEVREVWLDVPRQREGGLGRSVWPDVQGPAPHRAFVARIDGTVAISWPESTSPEIEGYVLAGRPPIGDFVDPDDVGIRYESPGYALNSE